MTYTIYKNNSGQRHSSI